MTPSQHNAYPRGRWASYDTTPTPLPSQPKPVAKAPIELIGDPTPTAADLDAVAGIKQFSSAEQVAPKCQGAAPSSLEERSALCTASGQPRQVSPFTSVSRAEVTADAPQPADLSTRLKCSMVVMAIAVWLGVALKYSLVAFIVTLSLLASGLVLGVVTMLIWTAKGEPDVNGDPELDCGKL